MASTRRRKTIRLCAHCGRAFRVDPRIGRRHRFCSTPECARASHLHALKKWRRSQKGREYFTGWVNVEHVRAWRRTRTEASHARSGPTGITLTKSLAAALRKLALLRVRRGQLALLLGLVARGSNLRSNLVLQDTIAFKLRELMISGHEILRNTTTVGRARRARRLLG